MLSASSKYAISALRVLSDYPRDAFIRVTELSDEAKVPGPYLSKLMKRLSQKKIVETRRGLCGGVRLSKKVNHISFFDICTALEDPILDGACILENRACSSRHPCALHKNYLAVQGTIIRFLKRARVC